MEQERRTEQFQTGLARLGISLTDAQIGQFLRYYEMLAEWNKTMNLTAVTAFDDVVSRHFLDSLSLVRAVPDLADQRTVDVGTGAGFPGIPLKIAFPDLSVVLVDSVGKKLRFADTVIRALGLSGVETVHGRAEDLARGEVYRERFDLCVCRAVADLAVLSEYSLPFVRVGGRVIAYKSADVEEECARAQKAAALLGGEIAAIVPYRLFGTDAGRALVRIDKIKETPAAYPRKAGTPQRSPLMDKN